MNEIKSNIHISNSIHIDIFILTYLIFNIQQVFDTNYFKIFYKSEISLYRYQIFYYMKLQSLLLVFKHFANQIGLEKVKATLSLNYSIGYGLMPFLSPPPFSFEYISPSEMEKYSKLQCIVLKIFLKSKLFYDYGRPIRPYDN